MLLKPIPLGAARLSADELKKDTKCCIKTGPCGLGEKALYLNAFFWDRRYYVPAESVTRVFKRVAMSKGGFTGKGIFASIPYVVVEYDGGVQKQCTFKYEADADAMLAETGKRWPHIKLVSAEAEERIARRAAEKAAKKVRDLSPSAREALSKLRKAAEYLRPHESDAAEYSIAVRRKRAYLGTRHTYRWAALAIMLMGAASLAYGIYGYYHEMEFAVYFTMLGLASIFLFSGANVLPTSKKNRARLLEEEERARSAMRRHVSGYRDFPVPYTYAHPAVLRRMTEIIEEGRAHDVKKALDVLKKDLKALNSSVEVDREEYEEIIAIKPLFLNENYK